MSLNYYLDGTTHTITTYDSTNYSWEDYAVVREDSSNKYIQLESNISHENASHMRVRKDGITYAVMLTQTIPYEMWAFGSPAQYLGEGVPPVLSSPTRIGSDYIWTDAQGGHELGFTEFYIALKSDGTIWTTGGNDNGEGGQGDQTTRSSFTQVGTDTDWISISCNRKSCNFALKNDNTLWGWGGNTVGNLGIGNRTPYSSPIQIGSAEWDSVTAGFNSVHAIKTNGTLWAWGNGIWGNFGNNTGGSGVYSSSPVQSGSDTDWQIIVEASLTSVFVLKNNGSLWAFGGNNYGQLAQGDIVYRSTPTQIGSLTNWTNLFAYGYENYFAIKSDGTLWSWGLNTYGTLGHGDKVHRSSPTQIGSDNDWIKVGAYIYTMYAIKSDGSIWACGYNNDAISMPGIPQGYYSSPVQLSSQSDWYKIGRGYGVAYQIIKTI